jgi:hypothetical protein
MKQLIGRELQSLIEELALYDDERQIWAVLPGITNSSGTIAMHLCGNLQHFVGHVLGHTSYARNRELEFSRRDVPRSELVMEIERTIDAVNQTLGTLTDEDLLIVYPDVLGGLRLPTGLFLQHLCVHLGHHLGQVGYLRRIVTGNGKSAGAISMHALA